jgi:hypothetical protein
MKIPIGSMYAIYGNIYHQYTPNVSIYSIHGSYGIVVAAVLFFGGMTVAQRQKLCDAGYSWLWDMGIWGWICSSGRKRYEAREGDEGLIPKFMKFVRPHFDTLW